MKKWPRPKPRPLTRPAKIRWRVKGQPSGSGDLHLGTKRITECHRCRQNKQPASPSD